MESKPAEATASSKHFADRGDRSSRFHQAPVFWLDFASALRIQKKCIGPRYGPEEPQKKANFEQAKISGDHVKIREMHEEETVWPHRPAGNSYGTSSASDGAVVDLLRDDGNS